jgi:hypothetical protein
MPFEIGGGQEVGHKHSSAKLLSPSARNGLMFCTGLGK